MFDWSERNWQSVSSPSGSGLRITAIALNFLKIKFEKTVLPYLSLCIFRAIADPIDARPHSHTLGTVDAGSSKGNHRETFVSDFHMTIAASRIIQGYALLSDFLRFFRTFTNSPFTGRTALALNCILATQTNRSFRHADSIY